MFWFAGARQVVVFAGEDYELTRYAVVLERAEPLLALLDGDAVVVVGVEHQSRSLDLARVLERAGVPVLIEVVEERAVEIFFVAVGAVARAVVADEVGDAAQGDGSDEAIGVADDPVGHESAVAAAGDAHAVLVDPGILLERGIDAGHDVLVIHAAPVVLDAALEFLAVAGGSARIAEEDRVAFSGVDLEFVVPIDAVLSGGAAVDAQDHRIFLAGFPVDGFDQEAFDVPAVGALEVEALDFGEREFVPKFFVDVGELAFAGAVERGDVDVVQVVEVVREIRHETGLFVHVEAVDGALAFGDLRGFVRGEIDAEHLLGAVVAGFEADIVRADPFQSAGDEIEILSDELGCDAAGGGRDVEFGELAALGLSGEEDFRAVGGPARHVVFEGMVGDLGERAAGGRDYPDVAVVVFIVLVTGAVGDEGDARGVGRPLRIEVVPIVAAGELLVLAGCGVDDPDVAALVVVPAGVVELVGEVLVVADVGLPVSRCDLVRWAGAREDREALAVGRPLVGRHAVLQVADYLGFAAGHREDADLRACAVGLDSGGGGRGVGGGGGGGWRGGAIRQKCKHGAIGAPARRVGIEIFGGDAARGGAAIGGDDPDGGAAAIALLIDRGHHVGNLFAVGREVGVAEEVEGEVIFGGDSAVGEGGCGRDQGADKRQENTIFHGAHGRVSVYRSAGDWGGWRWERGGRAEMTQTAVLRGVASKF